MARPPDLSRAIELAGPWQHRYVAANGARFHVAVAGPGDGPLVVLLHGFPEFWWTWRDQLPALADAGFRATAMDLRGYGGSDKTPRGYDPHSLAQDVSGVVKAMGARTAVVVGHGWGGYVGWAAAARHPREVSALATVAAPHPASMLRRLTPAAVRHVLAMQTPWLPERRIADEASGFVAGHLRAWAAAPEFPSAGVAATYQSAIGLWPASHCALEYHRWLFRSRARADGRAFTRTMRPPILQPVLCVAGAADPAVPVAAIHDSGRHVRGAFTSRVLPDVGHFPHEEDPAAVSDVLLDWLGALR
ncbi:MAG TPA: alpha/beta hydrolase [Nocardioidaceae bacterium]|nr:alpha/beta hydrolase [Nocardioidaceae bacterium]